MSREKFAAIIISPRKPYLSFNLKTSFRPDQFSSIAQTFTSTKPFSSEIFLIMFSVRSDEIPDDIFGQDIHNIPFLERCFIKLGNFFSNSFLSRVKKCIKSISPESFCLIFTPFGILPSSSKNPFGGFIKKDLEPSFSPSFSISDLPEYPAIFIY